MLSSPNPTLQWTGLALGMAGAVSSCRGSAVVRAHRWKHRGLQFRLRRPPAPVGRPDDRGHPRRGGGRDAHRLDHVRQQPKAENRVDTSRGWPARCSRRSDAECCPRPWRRHAFRSGPLLSSSGRRGCGPAGGKEKQAGIGEEAGLRVGTWTACGFRASGADRKAIVPLCALVSRDRSMSCQKKRHAIWISLLMNAGHRTDSRPPFTSVRTHPAKIARTILFTSRRSPEPITMLGNSLVDRTAAVDVAIDIRRTWALSAR
jgi:hypothetical protein